MASDLPQSAADHVDHYSGGKNMLRHTRSGPVLLIVFSTVPLVIAGCEQISGATNNSFTEVLGIQTQAGGTLSPDTSTPVTFDEHGKAILYGTLDDDADIDAYNLGPCQAGDTFSMEFSQGGGLDAAAALFDADSNLLILNDNCYYYPQPAAPRIEFTARWASPHLFLVVSTSPANTSSGSYNVSISGSSAAAPTPQAAVVVMDFNGATGASVGGRTPLTVPPFQGSSIDPQYADHTRELIDLIMAFVRQDYAGLEVVFYEDGDPNIPDLPCSTVYFGTYNAALLGLADSVDYYNGVPDQHAIIFTDTFALFMVLDPSVEEMAQALANVASHEVGHLLGLNHTKDPTSIMDITATAYQMLKDESFNRSPLHAAIFSTGYQNAIALLVSTLGGTADPAAARYIKDPFERLLKDPVEAQRAITGSFVVSKDFFCAHQCSHPD